MSLHKFVKIKDKTASSSLVEYFLPREIPKTKIPPIKTQGIKSKLVGFIASNIKWKGQGTWYEPFMGSGVVSFNIGSKNVKMSDINPHLISFFQAIQNKEITPRNTRTFLEKHGKRLSETDSSKNSYYYELREKFNQTHEPLYFLFLNRSCFNGLIRFNSNGGFNSPFGRKPERFSKGYITKICNQIDWVQKHILSRNYQFECKDWKDAISESTKEDFVYLDPPYYGRHTTYYNDWSEEHALELVEWTKQTNSGYAVSLWLENKYRKNGFIQNHWPKQAIREFSHYYFLGSTEDKRTNMKEALIIKNGFESPQNNDSKSQYTDYRG